MEHITISSRQIRSRLEQKLSILTFCPEKVCRYISLHGLYGSEPPQNKKKAVDRELLENLFATLRPGRTIHTFGVAYTAAALASCHGAEGKKAELAGMLHDHAKYYTGEEMLALCNKYKIELTPVEKINTALIHGKLGAYLAKERYGVTDEEVLSAIRYHTTGRPDMTLLEKILYVADYIEPRRQIDGEPYSLDMIRRECFRNIDSGLFMILTNTVTYLKTTNKEIDEMSIQTYEYYKKKHEERRDSI
ncbi:MAG: bis(5'-nucleosyl)-tetraphosphatase (symmetrical) YqeK [Lachnospiraceae bacterium]|nr:bis(5'-nucleosyl)-tetraphosphatase (symmetrical) YqeK [Lachnospiraceae bacterium]